MSDDLAVLFAKRFVQRRDVKAVQLQNGIYVPDRELKHLGNHGPLGFQLAHLNAHLAGQSTYGHYLLDNDDQARLFAFDIDLEKRKYHPDGSVAWEGYWCKLPDTSGIDPNISDENFESLMAPQPCSPRELWLDRASVDARNWFKFQMGMLARKLASVIVNELGLPCATAYSGNKGIHVYGFTGPMPAKEVREAALLVLDLTDEWELFKGQHFFKHKNQDPALGYPNFSLETFPKQDSLGGKDLGNLLRLPLGRNQKTTDPTFFLDLNTPPTVMKPHSDPVKLLETGDPYS